jgi:cytochrome P450
VAGGEAAALIDELLAPPFAHDPYPTASRLRELAAMHRTSLGFWLATDFASCDEVFRSPHFGQGFNAGRLAQDPRFEQSASLQLFGRMLPFIDPPDHTRIRKTVSSYFTPRSIATMRGYTQGLVDRLLDDFERRGGGDLVTDFAQEIPVAVVCQLLGGMGDEDQQRCRAWSEGLVEAVHPVCDDEMMRRADEAAIAFGAYFDGVVNGSAGNADGNDLASRLRLAQINGDLDHDEMVATATSLVGAAFHNTRNHIATGIYTMLRHPDQLARLRSDPTRAAAAVEEMLRFEPPVQLTLPRVALRDLDIGGVTMREGEHVCGLLSAAHRDPARYTDPDRVDIDRADGGSLALAFGIHSCIGAARGRMVGEIAIGSFIRRFARIELLDDTPPLDLPGLPSTRGFTSIPVAVAV